MNSYTYDELQIGHKEEFDVIITEEMMTGFCGITGDCNPLHTDDEYAKQLGNSGRVVYGMLTASFLSTLAGMYLPGKYSLIQKAEISFAQPIYIGDKITFTGEVIFRDDKYKLIELKVTARKDGEKVLRGKMRIGVQS